MRGISFRFGAILFGLLVLLLLEALLRITGVGRLADAGDPYVGFSGVVPLFVKNDAGDRYEIPLSRQKFFRHDSFLVDKPKDEFRVFCFGGSTVQGRPYAIETSFARWLELTLQAADRNRSFRVVNCGGVSYASYRLIPLIEECCEHEPDMFIVYTGQNEFLEERSYSDLKTEPRWWKGMHEVALRWHIYGLMRQCFRSQDDSPKPDTNLPQEVDALLDYKGGMSKYQRDDDWHRGVEHHYELNLRRIVRIANRKMIPVVLVNPVSNVRDNPPFKVEVNGDLSPPEQAEFTQKWEAAKQLSWEDLAAKRAAVDEVLALDPRHAEALYLKAKVLESLGDIKAARAFYLRSKDEDICPLRMTEAMHWSLKLVAEQTGTPLIDFRTQMEQESESGLLGTDEMIDHVHPRIPGHQRLAELLFDHLQSQRIITPQLGWESRRKELFQQNVDALPNSYFPLSVERLKGLQGWAKGRGTKLGLPLKPEPQGGQAKVGK